MVWHLLGEQASVRTCGFDSHTLRSEQGERRRGSECHLGIRVGMRTPERCFASIGRAKPRGGG